MTFVNSMTWVFEDWPKRKANIPENNNIRPRSHLWEPDDQASLETDIDRQEETSRSEGNNDETAQDSRASSEQTKSVAHVEVQSGGSSKQAKSVEVQICKSSKQTKSVEVQTTGEITEVKLKDSEQQTSSSSSPDTSVMIDDRKNNTNSSETAEIVHQQNSEVNLESSEEQISSTIPSIMMDDREKSTISETEKNVEEETSKMELNCGEEQISLPSASVMIDGSEEYPSSEIDESIPVQDDSDDDSLVTIIDEQDCSPNVGDYNEENPNCNKHKETSDENSESSEEQISSPISAIMMDDRENSINSGTTKLMLAEVDLDDDSSKNIIYGQERSPRVGDHNDETTEDNKHQETGEENLESSEEQISSTIPSIMMDDCISSEIGKSNQAPHDSDDDPSETTSERHESSYRDGDQNDEKADEVAHPKIDEVKVKNPKEHIDDRGVDQRSSKTAENTLQETNERKLKMPEEQFSSKVSVMTEGASSDTDKEEYKIRLNKWLEGDAPNARRNFNNENTMQEVTSSVVDVLSKLHNELDSHDGETSDEQSELSSDVTSGSGISGHSSSSDWTSQDSLRDSGLTSDNASERTVKGKHPIEFMVDTYLPHIKYQIEVKHIIDRLDFLGKRDVDVIRSKHAFCASDAFELLIQTIKESDSNGKWQAFLDALDATEYEHIRLLLEDKTEIHHKHNSDLLNLVTPELVRRIYFPDFMDTAYEKGLLTEEDKDEAEAQRREHGDNAGTHVILHKIDKYKKDWNTIFIEILEDEKFRLSDIAKLFRMIETNSPDKLLEGTTDITNTMPLNSNEKVKDWQLKIQKVTGDSLPGDESKQQDDILDQPDKVCVNSHKEDDTVTKERGSSTNKRDTTLKREVKRLACELRKMRKLQQQQQQQQQFNKQ